MSSASVVQSEEGALESVGELGTNTDSDVQLDRVACDSDNGGKSGWQVVEVYGGLSVLNNSLPLGFK